ncbi:ABC transporter permease [Membranihabitans marinus]|uniref:ABC transporter permease n=1 Tax=Membranihabitans marinus TaxID=1227546 RepID=UPI001F4900CE|nr:FtsX-like permease family protein [Membranihabitans marinus]
MKSLYIALKNSIHRPLGPILSTLLIGLSVALLVFSLRLQNKVEHRFSENLAGIQMILSAKGSPLQSVLCNLFHIDNPTGNISIQDAQPYLRPNHPYIQTAIPISLGDNYQGYRIVGCTEAFFNHYGLNLASGQELTENNSVVIGSTVAKELSLKIGDTFHSGHGIRDIGMEHEDGGPLKVVGILQHKGNITDQLIYTLASTVWAQHEGITKIDHGIEGDSLNHATPTIRSNEDLLTHVDREITAVLLVFKGHNMQVLNFGRQINARTTIMAADPAIEINRLYLWIGSGMDITYLLAMAIFAISMISIFISQWMTIKERISDMAIIRILGGGRSTVIKIILLESLIIGGLGIGLGYLLSATAFMTINPWLRDQYQVRLPIFYWNKEEILLCVTILCICVTAVLIPAWRLYRLPLASALETK